MGKNKDDSKSKFQKFIEEQSHRVDNWPDWKRNVLGRIDVLDERIKISKSLNEQSHNSK